MKTLLRTLPLLAFLASASVAEGAGAVGPAGEATGGFLDVASDPPAKISIDGADIAKTTPQQHLVLPAGHHTLTLVTVDGAHHRTIGFTVEPGQTTKLTIHLAS